MHATPRKRKVSESSDEENQQEGKIHKHQEIQQRHTQDVHEQDREELANLEDEDHQRELLIQDTTDEQPEMPPLVAYLIQHQQNLTDDLKIVVQEDARHLGFWAFLDKYAAVSYKTLLAVFDVDIDVDESADPDEILPLLKYAINRKVGRRQKRQDINTLDQVVDLLKTSKNIMVLTGAGVSVSCGIPDFRSKNGIYSRLSEFQLDDPQQMFDLEYFKIMPQTFYSFAHEIYPSNFKPSPSHKFIKLLEDKGKLLRNYTQNIDTIEQLAGITRLVQCHGSFATANCIQCKTEVDIKSIEPDIFNKTVPVCPVCPEEMEGVIKPGITFFGEKLPEHFDRCFDEDRGKVDLLIVMGSSLKVSPVADVKDKIPHDVPQILINMESLPHMAGFDVQLLGKCDVIVQEICRRLEWQLDLTGTSAASDTFSGTETPFHHIEPNLYLFEGGRLRADDSDSSDADSCHEDEVNSEDSFLGGSASDVSEASSDESHDSVSQHDPAEAVEAD